MTRRPDDSLGASWATRPYEPSAVATVLHPAVLEMLEAQVVFLFACFNAASAHELAKDDPKRAFADSVWSGYVDLAEIRAPLVGLLHNEDGNLDTRVDGQELIHRLGSPDALETAPLSTRVLVRYDAGTEDDDVPDAVLFRETRESRLLFRLMTDYFRLHPHARDGLSLAVFRNEDIQPVVAAAHQYLNQLASPHPPYDVLAPGHRNPYALTVTVFTEASDDVGVARWIEQWRDRG
jgi:DNA phosphorothioation-dependent restriction protein DptH